MRPTSTFHTLTQTGRPPMSIKTLRGAAAAAAAPAPAPGPGPDAPALGAGTGRMGSVLRSCT